MKNYTLILLLAVSSLFLVACEEKDEEVFNNMSRDIRQPKMPENGGGLHNDEPWDRLK